MAFRLVTKCRREGCGKLPHEPKRPCVDGSPQHNYIGRFEKEV